MSDKPRLDLTGVQPGDAAALRRFAVVVERHKRTRKFGLLGQVASDVVVGTLRRAADRLDAGDAKP